MIKTMLPINDTSCGWITPLGNRQAMPALTQSIHCDTLIIGAGYTGLSAARKLAELQPNSDIVLLDAQQAGEGASSRNSGYLVDSTLNDGHLSDAGMENYLAKYQLNRLGIEAVGNFVHEFNVDCDWNECGKYHATSLISNQQKLQQFSQTLSQCGIGHDLLENQDLTKRLGTGFYRMAVHTHGGVLLQPAKLARAMVNALPEQVSLFEHSPVIKWHSGKQIRVTTPQGSVEANRLLICTNGFMASMNVQRRFTVPLTLTASITRRLTDSEYSALGSPQEWGVLSAQAMGATVRLTNDQRIMIRNTAESFNSVNMNSTQLSARQSVHLNGLQRRFPNLPDDVIEQTWSGVTCISGNSANVFNQLDDRLYVAGCYNGGGIGLATLFGEQLALKSIGGTSKAMTAIENRPKPIALPPQPFLGWGVKTRLMKDRWFARAER